jgi:hypothetical protein
VPLTEQDAGTLAANSYPRPARRSIRYSMSHDQDEMTGPVPPTETIFMSMPSPRATVAVPVPVLVPELPFVIETTADVSDPFFSIVSVVVFPPELAVLT